MKPPVGLEGILCEQCNDVYDHKFVFGACICPPPYGLANWNGIECSNCQHTTVAWAENDDVVTIHADWLEGNMEDEDAERLWSGMVADMIDLVMKELNS